MISGFIAGYGHMPPLYVGGGVENVRVHFQPSDPKKEIVYTSDPTKEIVYTSDRNIENNRILILRG